eukprot:jgi/Psemu1/325614/estExt_fgenesh1_pg.C_2600015
MVSSRGVSSAHSDVFSQRRIHKKRSTVGSGDQGYQRVRDLDEQSSGLEGVINEICARSNSDVTCPECDFYLSDDGEGGSLYHANIDCNGYVFPNSQDEEYFVDDFQYVNYFCSSPFFSCETACDVDVDTKRISLKNCSYNLWGPNYSFNGFFSDELLNEIFIDDSSGNGTNASVVDIFIDTCELVFSIQDDIGNPVCPICESSMVKNDEGVPMFSLKIDCDENASVTEEVAGNLTYFFEAYRSFCDPLSLYAGYFVCETECSVDADAKSLSMENCSVNEQAVFDIFENIFAHPLATATKLFCYDYGAGLCETCNLTYTNEGNQTNVEYDITINNCRYDNATSYDYTSSPFYWFAECQYNIFCNECLIDVDNVMLSMKGCSYNGTDLESLLNLTSDVFLFDDFGSNVTTNEFTTVTFVLMVTGGVDLEAIEENIIATAQLLLDGNDVTVRRERQRRLYQNINHRYLVGSAIDNTTGIGNEIGPDVDHEAEINALASLASASDTSCPEYNGNELPVGSQCVLVTLTIEGGEMEVGTETFRNKIENSVESGFFESELREAGIEATVKLRQPSSETGELISIDVDPPDTLPNNSTSLPDSPAFVPTDPCSVYSGDCAGCVSNTGCMWCLDSNVCFGSDVDLGLIATESFPSADSGFSQSQCSGTATQSLKECGIILDDPPTATAAETVQESPTPTPPPSATETVQESPTPTPSTIPTSKDTPAPSASETASVTASVTTSVTTSVTVQETPITTNAPSTSESLAPSDVIPPEQDDSTTTSPTATPEGSPTASTNQTEQGNVTAVTNTISAPEGPLNATNATISNATSAPEGSLNATNATATNATVAPDGPPTPTTDPNSSGGSRSRFGLASGIGCVVTVLFLTYGMA